MTNIRRIYHEPVETAMHLQIKNHAIAYFEQHAKLLKRPSRRYALNARRALKALRQSINARARELLALYSEAQNQGKMPIYGRPRNKKKEIAIREAI